MTENINHPTPFVIEMYTLAREYCRFTERVEGQPREDVIEFYRKILPLLYTRASMIPDNEPDAQVAERFVTEPQWEVIFKDLREVFQENDEFYFIDYSDPGDIEPWKGSLADQLADIYQDLKDFQILFEKNTYTARESAVYQCRQLFVTHWGERLTRSLHLLHAFSFTKTDTYEDL